MTTLLVFVFLIGGSTDGGASTATQKINFANSALCEKARKGVESSGAIWSNGLASGGRWKVQAVCVTETRE